MIEYGLLLYLGMQVNANVFFYILLGFLMLVRIIQMIMSVYNAGKKNAEEEHDKK